jgi:hypothetical protein
MIINEKPINLYMLKLLIIIIIYEVYKKNINVFKLKI